jgi:opacity protein-like surface antigen
MIVSRAIFIALLATTTVALTQPAFAQIGIGARVGALQSEDADDPSAYGGAQLRWRLGPVLGLEASIDYRREEFDNGATEIRSYPILASVLLYPFPLGPLQPYAIGGVGWYFSRIEIKDGPHDETRRFGAHVGAGLDLPIAPKVVLNGDIRWIFYDVDSKEIRDQQLKEPNTNGWLATVGLTVYLP